jgi:metal-responsive CopG/Arc/MetJ family transcriptional regulator
MKADPRKVQTCIAMPAPLRAELDAITAEQERSRSYVVAQALRKFIARQRQTHLPAQRRISK